LDESSHSSSTHSVESLRPLGEEPLDARNQLAKAIARRSRVTWWLGLVFAAVFALLVTPAITAERWLGQLGIGGTVVRDQPVAYSIRVPPFAGQDAGEHHISGGGVFLARGQKPDRDQASAANEIAKARPGGPLPYAALFVLVFVCAAIFTHHVRRSNKGRLVRVQVVSLVSIAILAAAVKIVMLATALSILVVPVALLAMVPTLVLDRIVGLATGVLAALVACLLVPFDVGVAILLLAQAAVAGLVIAEQPKVRWRTIVTTGAVTTVIATGTDVLLKYLTTGAMPSFATGSPMLAAAIGPVIAAALTAVSVPIYQLLVGEITRGKLIELEDLSHPLLKQIAERSPGTWQHSLMMANMAEIAANAIGANGRLVRVGAYFHDLGKSLAPKYFIENLEPGEQSPHDKLQPEYSCEVIFAHVTEGVVTARREGLHERIVDFMHMHHGNGVLEYFWGKTREQGNPRHLSIEQFRYPGHPPQSRETAILAICDAVEAASRTLKKPDPAAIDSLVQRIVYGKLHLGQLDESGLSMADLRRVADSLRETIRHANHGRIEYPWQKAQQDASASSSYEVPTSTGTAPRLDSLDRKPNRDTGVRPAIDVAAALARDRSGEARASDENITQPRTLPAGSGKHTTKEAFDDTASLQRDVEIRSVDQSEPGEVLELIPRGKESSSATPIPDAKDSLRSSVPPGPAPDVVTPATFDARRAAQLPPSVAPRRPGTAPPPVAMAAAKPAAQSYPAQTSAGMGPVPARTAPPPELTPAVARYDESARTEPVEPTFAPPAERAVDELAVTKPPRSARGKTSQPPIAAGSPPFSPPVRTHVGPMPGPRDGLDDDGFTSADRERFPAPSTPPRTMAGVTPSTSNRLYVGPPAPEVQEPTGPPRPPPGHPSRIEPPPGDDLDGPTKSNRIYMGPPASASDSLEDEPLASPPPPPGRVTTSPGRPAPAASSPAPARRTPTGRTEPPDTFDDAPPAGRVTPGRAAPADPSGSRRAPAGRTSPPDTLEDDPLASPPPPPGRVTTSPGRTTPPPAPGASRRAQTEDWTVDDDALASPPAPPGRVTTSPGRTTPPPAPRKTPPSGRPAAVQEPRTAGPPPRQDLENAITNPPPFRRRPSDGPITSLPGLIVEAAHQVTADLEERITGERPAVRPGGPGGRTAPQTTDNARTEPSMPRFELPLRAPPSVPPGNKKWSSELADRVDRALGDEWGTETPVVPPSPAELRSLLGAPDPTRKQSLDELEALHRAASETPSEPDILNPRRPKGATAEVDPDDIEAAIEIAPPARKPTGTAIAVAKPKKPE
jgi:cyclic-di-AMP phosphodiesterase PgpH